MKILIDANAISDMLSDTSSIPSAALVQKWIQNGGKPTYGGTKYINEIPQRCRKLLSLWASTNRAIQIPAAIVDAREATVKGQESSNDFDDPHLVAILIEGKCKLVFSNDKRSYKFLTHTRWFKGKNKPKIIHDDTAKKTCKDVLKSCN